MPLQANSAIQPVASASSGGPGRHSSHSRSGSACSATGAGGGQLGGHRDSSIHAAGERAVAFQGGGLPATAAQRSRRRRVAPPTAFPGRDVQHHGVRRVAGGRHAGEQVLVGVVQVAEHGEQHAAVVGVLDPVGGELLVPGHRHQRQPLELLGQVDPAGALVPAVRGRPTGRADQPDLEVLGHQVAHDRGGDADRTLHRRRRAVAAVGDAPVVDEQRAPRLPLLLLAAHHQLAGPGTGRPVDPAQVVAEAVLADRHVGAAAAEQVAGAVVAGAGPAPGQRDPWQRLGAWRDQDGRGRGQRLVEVDHAERVADADVQRADGVAAPALGVDLVAAPHRRARRHRLDHEPRRRTQRGRELLLEQQGAGASPGVADLDLDLRGVAGLDLEGADVAAYPHVALGTTQHQPRQRRDQHRQQADPDEVALADLDAADDRGGAGRQEAPATDGQVPHAITSPAPGGPS